MTSEESDIALGQRTLSEKHPRQGKCFSGKDEQEDTFQISHPGSGTNCGRGRAGGGWSTGAAPSQTTKAPRRESRAQRGGRQERPRDAHGMGVNEGDPAHAHAPSAEQESDHPRSFPRQQAPRVTMALNFSTGSQRTRDCAVTRLRGNHFHNSTLGLSAVPRGLNLYLPLYLFFS